MEKLIKISECFRYMLIEIINGVAYILLQPLYTVNRIRNTWIDVWNEDDGPDTSYMDDDEPSQKDVVVRGFRK